MNPEDFVKEEPGPGGIEKALVTQLSGDFVNIDNDPKLSGLFKEIGLTASDLKLLVAGNFPDAIEPVNEVITDGDIKEDVTVRVAQIGDKQIEVSRSRRRDSTQTPSSFELQLRQKEPAYKILVGLEGEAVLRLPQTTYPRGMIYSATEAGDDIPFLKGTIAIIQAPTAWSFVSSQKNFEYLYISSPKHSSSQDTLAHNPAPSLFMDSPEGKENIDPANRGLLTNRYLSTNLPLTGDNCDERVTEKGLTPDHWSGELELLSLSLEDIRGKKTLDVGVGGGRALEQALQNGFDYYGIDVAPAAQQNKFRPVMSAVREQVALDNLKRVIGKYPDKLVVADAARYIPFPNNSFDIVLACISLPNYARNPQEVVNSILEMIRVSKEKVVFTTNFSDISEIDELQRQGIGMNKFNFGLRKFLDALAEYGITYEFKQFDDQSQPETKIVSAHLNVSGKNTDGLSAAKKEFIAQVDSFTK